MTALDSLAEFNDLLNLESISVARFKRAQRYPGVPFKPFTDWYEHKQWMLEQKRLYLRKANNERILRDASMEEERNKGG